MVNLPTWLLIAISLASFAIGLVVKVLPVFTSVVAARLEREKFEHTKSLDRLDQFSQSVALNASRFELLARLLQDEPPVPDPLPSSADESVNTLVEIQRARSEAAQTIGPLLRQLGDLQAREMALRRRLVGDPDGSYEVEFQNLSATLASVQTQIDAGVARLLDSPRLYVFSKMPEDLEKSGVPVGSYFVVTGDGG